MLEGDETDGVAAVTGVDSDGAKVGGLGAGAVASDAGGGNAVRPGGGVGVQF